MLTNVGGYVTDFVIPKSVVGCTVTTIGEEAFNKCEKLIEIKIPDNITSIKDSAFSDCVCLTKNVCNWFRKC
mgnify:CR=1 FL=1